MLDDDDLWELNAWEKSAWMLTSAPQAIAVRFCFDFFVFNFCATEIHTKVEILSILEE